MLFPMSHIGAITPQQRDTIIKQSRLYGMYERYFDRESAYERISEQRLVEQRRAEETKLAEERDKLEIQREKERAREYKRETPSTQRRTSSKSPFDKALGSAATSIGRSVGTQIVRGILGAIFKR